MSFRQPYKKSEVRPLYWSGTWRYALGKPAEEHPQYAESVKLAQTGPNPFDPWWIRTWQDVAAVVNHGCWFHYAAGDYVCRFIETTLMLSSGLEGAAPFTLLDWQRWDYVMPLYGWKHPDRSRRFKTGALWISKKNGKSTLSSALGLYHLVADGEDGPEVYSAAGDRNQAGIIYGESSNMVRSSPPLARRLITVDSRKTISAPLCNGTYRALSADASLQEGLKASAVLIDEIHVQPNRTLFDTLIYAGRSRKQPIMIQTSTAGIYNPNGLGYQQWDYARKVNNGIQEDHRYFALMYGAEKTDDWNDESVWIKSNPSIDATFTIETMRDEHREASQNTALQNNFRRYCLNQWVQQAERFIDIALWNKNARDYDVESLRDRPCWGGMDLSSKIDLSSFGLVFPPEADGEPLKTLSWSWIPGENMKARIENDHVPYDRWVADGWIEKTEGNVIDFRAIRNRILWARDEMGFKIQEIGFDPKFATQLEIKLGEDGFTMVSLNQSVKTYNPALSELQKMLIGGTFGHNGNPVLCWAADNLAVKTNPDREMRPDKAHCFERIDPMAAMLMALSRWLVSIAVPEPDIIVG